MTIFEEIEKRLESMVESFFGRQFPSPLQPAEIAKSLTKEMDRARKVSMSETYAPNEYAIQVSRDDYENLGGLAPSLCREFRGYLLAHAKRKGYALSADVKVSFAENDDLKIGMMHVASEYTHVAKETRLSGGTQIISPEEAANLGLSMSGAHSHLMDIASGRRYDLSADTTTVGRDPDNDIVLADPSVSRRHATLRREGPVFLIKDSNSTNGTLVNDKLISEAVLEDEDRLTIGTVTVVFRSRS